MHRHVGKHAQDSGGGGAQPASPPPVGPQHFIHCHPEHEHAAPKPDGWIPQSTENCWHCGTATDQGCYCLDCEDAADVIPPGSIYHCKRCGRFWAYMPPPNIIRLTF